MPETRDVAHDVASVDMGMGHEACLGHMMWHLEMLWDMGMASGHGLAWLRVYSCFRAFLLTDITFRQAGLMTRQGQAYPGHWGKWGHDTIPANQGIPSSPSLALPDGSWTTIPGDQPPILVFASYVGSPNCQRGHCSTEKGPGGQGAGGVLH